MGGKGFDISFIDCYPKKVQFRIKKPYLRAASSLSSNLAVVFLVAIFATRVTPILIFDIVFCMLFLYTTVRTELMIEEL